MIKQSLVKKKKKKKNMPKMTQLHVPKITSLNVQGN